MLAKHFYLSLIQKHLTRFQSTTSTRPPRRNQNAIEDEGPKVIDGFKVYEVQKVTNRRKRYEKEKRDTTDRNERYKTMSLDQEWTDVWPAATTFRQSVVPLPINQGFVQNRAENEGIPPGKYGNAELMKIPNFFHLTPAHIKKHCDAMKKFCTAWPTELKTDADCDKHFPLEIRTTDYVYAGPSIRDERARIVTLKIPLASLKLDEHARVKFIKLAGDRFDSKTGIISITSDKCPYRHQNLDYCKYLLSVLFYESLKVEEWEKEMGEDDWLEYAWDKSQSKKNLANFLFKTEKINQTKVETLDEVQAYAKALKENFDKGETSENIEQLKQSALKLLKLDSPKVKTTATA